MKKSYKKIIPFIFAGASLFSACSSKSDKFVVTDKGASKVMVKHLESNKLYYVNFDLRRDIDSIGYNNINVNDTVEIHDVYLTSTSHLSTDFYEPNPLRRDSGVYHISTINGRRTYAVVHDAYCQSVIDSVRTQMRMQQK